MAKQAVEKSRINNVIKFAEISESIFIKKQSEAYTKFTEVNKILKPLEEERKKMTELKDGLRNQIDCLNENILLIEEKFDNLLKIQNYYNLLMDSEMRLEYDWIKVLQFFPVVRPLNTRNRNYHLFRLLLAKACKKPFI